MYIHIYLANASQNTQLCIEISHQNDTLQNNLILSVFRTENENTYLSQTDRQPTPYRKLFRRDQAHDAISGEI